MKGDSQLDLSEFGSQIKVIVLLPPDIQGLAMSRSIGDNVSKPIGVTSSPEIIKIATDPRDRFILLASDGIW